MNNLIVNQLNEFVLDKHIKDKISLLTYGDLIELSIYPNGINKGGRIKIQEESKIGLEYFKSAITYILNIC